MMTLFITLILTFFTIFSWKIYLIMLYFALFMVLLLLPSDLNYSLSYLYMDGLSFSLVVLTIFIFVLMLLASSVIYSGSMKVSLYLSFFSLLMLLLVMSFLTKNMIMFYFLFESSLIPTFALILGWGVQPERLQASIYFFFYTLFMSIPLLFILFFVYYNKGSFLFLVDYSFKGFTSLELFLCFFLITMAFFIKMPMFFFHLWLPKAHVEAPVSGSMILAGVLLKLGGYGLCRLLSYSSKIVNCMSSYIFSLSLIGTIFIGFVCCRMSDMKALIAYSSVAHMGLLVCSLVSLSMVGFQASLMVMITHGITSSGLFSMVNILYERLMSRSLFINKGMMTLLPSYGVFMFMLCASNFSTPPFISLLSELYLLFSIMSFSMLMMVVFPIGSLLGTIFSIYLFSFSQHGLKFNINYSFMPSSFSEINMLSLHIIPLITLILVVNSMVYYF